MGMTRHERNSIHKKQEVAQVLEGAPEKSDLKNGVMVLRTTNEGLVLYVKHNDVLYKKVLDKG